MGTLIISFLSYFERSGGKYGTWGDCSNTYSGNFDLVVLKVIWEPFGVVANGLKLF